MTIKYGNNNNNINNQSNNLSFNNKDYYCQSSDGNTLQGVSNINEIFNAMGIPDYENRARMLNMSIQEYLQIAIKANNLKILPEQLLEIINIANSNRISFQEAWKYYFKKQIDNNMQNNQNINEIRNNFKTLMQYEADNEKVEINKYVQIKYGNSLNEILKDISFIQNYVNQNQAFLNELMNYEMAENELINEAKSHNIEINQYCKIKYGKNPEQVIQDKIRDMEYSKENIVVKENNQEEIKNNNVCCEGTKNKLNVVNGISFGQDRDKNIRESYGNTNNINKNKVVFGTDEKTGDKIPITFGQDRDKNEREVFGNTDNKVRIDNEQENSLNSNYYN